LYKNPHQQTFNSFRAYLHSGTETTEHREDVIIGWRKLFLFVVFIRCCYSLLLFVIYLLFIIIYDLFLIYSLFVIRCLFVIYSLFICCLFAIYSIFIPCFLVIYSFHCFFISSFPLPNIFVEGMAI
jgi:hypothetical protein